MRGLLAKLPPFVTAIWADRTALHALLAATLTIAAAGLDPHILDPGQRRMQAILATDAGASQLLIAAAAVQAGFLLAGGAIADLWRSVRLVQAALLGLVVASVGALAVPELPGVVPFRVLAWACDGILIPFSVGVVANLYAGETRGIAIGLLLGGYGAAQFLAPILLGVFGPTGPELAAFGLCIVVALAALWFGRRRLPALPGALPSQRLTIVTTAIWAFGLILVVEGVIQAEPGPILTGSVIVLGALAARRVLHAPREEGVKARAGGTAIAAGLVIGVGQSVPMFAMPVFFNVVQGFDQLVASILIIPFVVGLAAAGPTAGILLARFTPRQLILAGVWAIALANFLFVAVLGEGTPYWVFIFPFAILGAGFMVSTAIRTAVIFASTPKRLAGTAGALNEASLGVGTRMGLTIAVLLKGGAVLDVSTIEWLRVGFVAAGIVGVVGGLVVFILLGPHDPVKTMWDLRDEREAA